MPANIHNSEATNPNKAPKGVTVKPIEIPSAICRNSNLGCSPSKTACTNFIEPHELTSPPIGPSKSLKMVLPERKGVIAHTKRGGKTVIKIKYSIEIILKTPLEYWRHFHYYLQLKKHLNQNKYLKKL